MITLNDYLKGRDKLYSRDYTDLIEANALHTVDVVNKLIARMAEDGVAPLGVDSGWRPLAVNEHTGNAAEHSRHITAQACDLRDTPNRDLCKWAVTHQDAMKDCGVVAMENPGWTKDWLHVQTVAVASGRFIFIPSAAPAMADRLGV